MLKIKTQYIYPPIPDRSMDWCATYDDYDGAPDAPNRGHIGYGENQQDAIDDLVENFPREGEGQCPDCYFMTRFGVEHCASCEGTGLQLALCETVSA